MYVVAKLLQSCLTLCDPMDCSLPGTSVHGILQARILEWAAVPSSRGSSRPRDPTCISYTQAGSSPLAAPGKPSVLIHVLLGLLSPHSVFHFGHRWCHSPWYAHTAFNLSLSPSCISHISMSLTCWNIFRDLSTARGVNSHPLNGLSGTSKPSFLFVFGRWYNRIIRPQLWVLAPPPQTCEVPGNRLRSRQCHLV